DRRTHRNSCNHRDTSEAKEFKTRPMRVGFILPPSSFIPLLSRWTVVAFFPFLLCRFSFARTCFLVSRSSCRRWRRFRRLGPWLARFIYSRRGRQGGVFQLWSRDRARRRVLVAR